MSDLTKRLSGLNPFSSSNPEKRRESEDDDKGEEIDATTVAGGGHGGRTSEITKNQLRVSQALRSFLVDRMVLSEAEAGLDADDDGRPSTAALKALLEQSHIRVPAALMDRSRPLPEYFVSSSHNTYLLAHQLFGASCATAYETALNTGSRCVEIDAWDNPDDRAEPKVTHGYTLVSNIPFRLVCETIRDVVDREAAAAAAEGDRQGYQAAPILLSLENHCDAEGQQRLVDIMLEVFGDRLLSEPVRAAAAAGAGEPGYGDHVRLEELGSKVVVMVEYHFAGERADDSDSDSDTSSDDEEERRARREYKRKREETAAANSIVIPALAGLGVYAQSVKPQNNSWFEDAAALAEPALPHHHLINVSESGLARLLPDAARNVSAHNAHHLMRVYPKGTRISSRNLQPRQFWAVGAQVCALNWQTFGAAMQINEALFSGTDGFPYLTCTLVHPDGETKRKTRPYRRHRLTGFLRPGRESPDPTDPMWDETLEWEYDDDELVFLRLLVKSDDAFARNPVFAVAAMRLLYVPEDAGWSFIRMLDLKGHETRCALLVKMEILDR
ncbi:1-phosphatidylinositol-4,5-bisphosphate phosphodiesterase delta-3 [Gaeumannomyces tritici R3-111a-1]|uniref:Phosphoinositide phospholipase C n=1 Tax=Gaeumannomyces tritici (strain R3-111a-1) TaxID=644352 RepID=J3NLK7_GAET3|nr:1-phosphatidylinositol-4,5-bisphosphate phosphodiesterase delta-3 [Gaeumannomyces tritici R3-111a-1]EJT82182.1 1-phosphatidylinositol-4,5-bisphosphate phosphodiesterase delta-3 [Gaeumannomyces tritici R3-111a-1]